jgi:hypothetical protein
MKELARLHNLAVLDLFSRDVTDMGMELTGPQELTGPKN